MVQVFDDHARQRRRGVDEVVAADAPEVDALRGLAHAAEEDDEVGDEADCDGGGQRVVLGLVFEGICFTDGCDDEPDAPASVGAEADELEEGLAPGLALADVDDHCKRLWLMLYNE